MKSVDRPPADPIAAALAAVRSRIEGACARCGRDLRTVTLVAVSKTKPAADVVRANDAGHSVFGENRVQEALAKQAEVDRDVEWHLVGALQRNKARHAVGAFKLLHGVDDSKLLVEIDRRAAAKGLRQPLLLQVRLGNESSKSGIDPADLSALVDEAVRLDHIELRGLMTIPPPVEQPEHARHGFARLRELRDAEAARSGVELPELSMGMSGDFEVAVEEGATLVRIGTAIFGARI
ncbi:MAG: YggS family pyridoxal phosphate-dependent enzyme [Acidobacteria bacterium]|nr:MAG: YggS family pyridoxal phosphate-dependent enzyme [Acidobacteriota bacterium]